MLYTPICRIFKNIEIYTDSMITWICLDVFTMTLCIWYLDFLGTAIPFSMINIARQRTRSPCNFVFVIKLAYNTTWYFSMHIVQSEFESTLTYQVFNPRTVPFSFLFTVWMKAAFGITSIFLHNFATIFFATVQLCGEGTSWTDSALFAASVFPLCLNLNKPLHVVTSLAVMAWT